jgi:hypothetical protein
VPLSYRSAAYSVLTLSAKMWTSSPLASTTASTGVVRASGGTDFLEIPANSSPGIAGAFCTRLGRTMDRADVAVGSVASVWRCLSNFRFTLESRHSSQGVTCLKSAMCGRLRVGKRNLHVAGLVGAAMCSAFRCGSHNRWPRCAMVAAWKSCFQANSARTLEANSEPAGMNRRA